MALIAHTSGRRASTDFTTAAVDTTGANFLVAALTYSVGGTVVTDSNGNTWSTRPEYGNSGVCRHILRFFYCLSPTVGTGHTFTMVGGGGGNNAGFGSMCIAAFSGVTAFNVDGGFFQTTTGNTTIQPGAITPTAGDVVLAAWGIDDPTNTSWTVDSGFTIVEKQDVSPGIAYGCALAYLLNAAGTALNPTFTRSNANTTGSDTATIMSFTAPASNQYARPIADDLVGGWTAV